MKTSKQSKPKASSNGVTGISPSTGSTSGSGTSEVVTITGRGFTGATNVWFGGVALVPPQGSTVVSDTEITTCVPQGTPGTVNVQVLLSSGLPTPVNSPADQFTYWQPEVTGISPSTGSTSGSGTSEVVTITGRGFTGATNVWFGGVALVPPQGSTVVSDTEITTCVPQGTAGTVDVQVILSSGVPTPVNPPADQYAYINSPQVTSLSVNTGPNAGGTQVTINGSGFTGATQVMFGNSAVTITPGSVTDSQIKVSSPSGDGTVDITVVTPNGTSPLTPEGQFMYDTIPFSFAIPDQVAEMGIYLSMYGFLQQGYTNSFGTNIPTNTNVILISTGSGYDYIETSGVAAGTSIPPFVFVSQATPVITVDIPNVNILSARIVIGISNPSSVTTVDAASGNKTLPQATINVATTNGFSQSGSLNVYVSSGITQVEYTGLTIDSFTGCSGGTGTLTAEDQVISFQPPALTSVAASSGNQVLPQTTINVASTTGFASEGTLYICTNAGITVVTYTGLTGNSFTGCSGGNGTLLAGMIISSVLIATPVVNDANGDVAAPTPLLQAGNVYDFFEFTYLPVGGYQTMTINTSAIDQFGMPIQLVVNGQSVQPGYEVGVISKRQNLISQFSSFTQSSPYQELIYPSGSANPVIRILSPSDQLSDNPVIGLTVSNTTTAQGSLSEGTVYSYVVMAVIDGEEISAPAMLAQSVPSPDGSIIISWAEGTAGITYNVYRGVPEVSKITWYCIVENLASASYTDSGPEKSGNAKDPVFDPLGNYFDESIGDLFNSTNSIVLTVTDGSSPANGLQYTFSGIAKPAPPWLNQAIATQKNQVIEFSCKDIKNNPNGITPLIPIGSLVYVFAPFFNTNTSNPSNPGPPSWNGQVMLFADLFPTAMAFGADGIFADNLQQSAALYASLTNTTIASGSNNSTLPQSTIQVASTAGFQGSGVLYIPGLNTLITYTGISDNSFTGCTGGGGVLSTGVNVYGPLQLATVSGTQTLPSSTIVASATAGYPVGGGTLYIWASANDSPVVITYNGISGSSFTGCSGGTGTIQDGDLVAVNNCQPIGLQQNAYSTALGSIEDSLNAAILRGIASSINSVNWANAPTNPTASAGPTKTANTSTYYYVITAVNNSGESTPSEEVSYTADNTSILLIWTRVSDATSSYNIYRGVTAGGENTLIANTNHVTFEDNLEVASLPQASPPISGSTIPPDNLGALAVSQTGGSLPANTYYYVVTTLGYNGESMGSNEVNIQVSSGMNAVKLTWNRAATASAYKIYRGTSAGQENILAGIVQGGSICSFTDGNNADQTPPPNIYYAPGSVSDIYAQFFHQTDVSIGGLAYADPYDDQGGQSSTLTATAPESVNIKMLKWFDT